MKICICTTPIRNDPTGFPPLGSLAIIQSLRKIGHDAQFYNIDYWRPDKEPISAYFYDNQFDVVGISAVVSTAYSYTKYLADLIRSVSPDTAIVVGGNLAASAEVLLRKCKVDFCVIGDGEVIFQDLILALSDKSWTREIVKAIPGLSFLDEDGQFHFTGYGKPLPGDAIEWPDYSILEADGSLPHYIHGVPSWISEYGLEVPAALDGKKTATIITTKGCVARCTFCHRWEKGYRMRPIDQVIEHIRFLQDKYDVGFLNIADENFGSNRPLTSELVTHLGQMGIIWRAGGVRARTVDLETLRFWQANGSRAVYYGIESGSQTMLDVMEKNTAVDTNVDALKWTHQAGLFTISQFVIAMPGETDQTINETIDFLKKCMPYLRVFRGLPGSSVSVNYAQALPGTPLYEYAREHGFLGNTLDDEEHYLITISDIDAYSFDHFINYTGQPMLKVLVWVHRIAGELNAHYIQHVLGIKISTSIVLISLLLMPMRHLVGKIWPSLRTGMKTPLDRVIEKHFDVNVADHSGYFNLRGPGALSVFFFLSNRRWSYALLALSVAYTSRESVLDSLKLIADHIQWSVMRRFRKTAVLPQKSLRKIVDIRVPDNADQGSEAMIPLRTGR